MSDLVPFRFHGDQIDVVREGEQVFIPIKRVCEHLGIGHAGQLKGLRKRPWASVDFKSIDTNSLGSRQVACLPLKALPMWLATIELSKVHEDHREKLEVYQVECAEALRAYFFGPPKISVERQEFALDIAHGKRIHEDPNLKAKMSAECAVAARATGRTVSAVHGVVRRYYGIPGVYRLSIFL